MQSHSTERSESWVPELTSGALLAVMNVTFAISLAALVFSGPLSFGFNSGIAYMLVGHALGGLLIALFSGYRANIAAPRSGLTPILATIALGVHLSVADLGADARLATVLVGIMLTVVVIGGVFYLVGQARLGGLVRYLPYPVMGGFFAGLGYLLSSGGVAVALGPVADLQEPTTLLTLDSLLHLAPAVAFAVALYVLEKRIRHWGLMPGLLLLGMVLTHGTVILSGVGMDAAVAAHWFPDMPSTGQGFLPVLHPEQLALVQWQAIWPQLGTVLVMALIATIMLLLDVSGIEIITDRELDPNRELKAAGVGNVLNGLAGGALAVQAASDVAFTYKLGARRLAMVVAYSICIGAVLVVGPEPIRWVPTWLLGGMLIYLGLDFLVTWVVKARRALPLIDYGVVLVILVSVASLGILQGVGVGVLLSVVLFVVSYSRLSVVKARMDGSEQHSQVDRHPEARDALDTHGERIQVFVLQGFLFFGTASRLLDEIRARLDAQGHATEFLVLDFAHVDALDTSAVNTFAKLAQLCGKSGTVLMWSGCSEGIAARLGSIDGVEHAPTEFPRLADAMARAEDTLLRTLGIQVHEDEPLPTLLQGMLGDEAAADVLAGYLDIVSTEAGETLFAQGDPGNAMYFVLKGTVRVELHRPDGSVLPVRTFRAGAVLGEMAIYTREARSASAHLASAGAVARLDVTAFERIRDEQPRVAMLLDQAIVGLMAERQRRTDRQVIALAR